MSPGGTQRKMKFHGLSSMTRIYFKAIVVLIWCISGIQCQDFSCTLDTVTVAENADPSTILTTCSVSSTSYEMTIESTTPASGRYTFQKDSTDDTKYNLMFEEGFQPDYENTVTYTVIVTATQASSEHRNVKATGMSSILIIIQDVDDVYPSFNESTTTVYQLEGVTNPTLASLEVTDKDGTTTYNAQSLTYTFDNDYDGTFGWTDVSRNSTTNVINIELVKPLDYETRISYTLTITATDGGGLSADATIIINVEDVEDTPPFFRSEAPYTEISEDAPKDTSVLNVTAVDGDTGINRPVSYDITAGNDDTAFYIKKDDQGYGIVYVNNTLDRDHGTALYTLTITATEDTTGYEDSADDNIQASTICTISITDVDDCPPTFSQEQYTANVPENSPNGFVVTFQDNNQLTVTDADSAPNAIFELSLTDNLDMFDVAPSEGQTSQTLTIKVKDNTNLDYEKYTSDIITVVATDKNVASLVTTATVTINIQDVNDVPPEFTEIDCPAFPEDVATEKVICHVQAKDFDSAEFSTIGYSASFGQLESCLKIDSTTGDISVIQNNDCFDYEISDVYYITIMARDAGGTGQLVSNTTELYVTDVNDNPPVFQVTVSKVSLNENEADFYVPLTVQATDADSGENAEITFTLSDGGDYFTITNNGPSDSHTYTATIKPTEPLDYEAFPECKDQDDCPINVVVTASDTVHNTDYTITVLLMDVNDEAPEFESNTYEAEAIREDAPEGTSVETVKATDADSSTQYNTIVYRLQNDEAANFVIDSATGLITVASKAKLDPDLYSPRKLSYNLTITADDGGFHDDANNTCFVIVPITDVDNKQPVFDNNGIYSTSIMENTTMDDQPFFTITATDQDSDADLHYSIDFDNSLAYDYKNLPVTDPHLDELFKLDETSGDLTIINPVDREVMVTIILHLIVDDEATEDGFPSENTGTLTITVNDTNDNPPDFSSNDYKGSVEENAKGAVIQGIQISATDLDGVYGVITYSIAGSDPAGADVNIDSTTATMTTGSTGFDYETEDTVIVYVQAKDNGQPPLMSTATVTISVINVNEYPPEFDEAMYNFEIDEDSTEFIDGDDQVSATDDDAGDYGVVNYKLDSSSEGLDYFSMNATTGILTVTVENGLDYETKQSYSLTVLAIDDPSGPSTTQKTVSAAIVVSVQSINDNTPKITNLPNEDNKVKINEDYYEKSASTAIFTIKATDADLPANSEDCMLSYFIDDPDGYFAIPDETKPDVYVGKSLLNQNQSYNLLITVSDKGENPGPLSDSEEFFITIEDVNNNPPIIYEPEDGSDVGNISEGSYPESKLLFTVHYTDADTNKNNRESNYKLDTTCPTGVDVSTSDFSIQPVDDDQTGETVGYVYLQGDLARNNCYEYKLTVIATNTQTDDEPETGSATYYFQITPQDLYPPQFPSDETTFSASFLEDVDYEDAMPVTLPQPYDPDIISGVDKPVPIYCYIVGGDPDVSAIFKIKNYQDSEGNSFCNMTNYQTLDREAMGSYMVIIAPSESEYGPTEKDVSRLQVNVAVEDVNDNPPTFDDDTFYGGVSSDSTKGSTIVRITATDLDSVDTGELVFSSGPMQIESDDGTMGDVPQDALMLDSETGEFKLNYNFLDTMKGYMYIPVYVHDSNESHVDAATVEVYVVSETQKVLCSSTMNTSQFDLVEADFVIDFSSVLGVQVVVDIIEQHTEDGKPIPGQSDIYIHMVKNHVVMEAEDALNLVNAHSNEVYSKIFNKYYIFYIGPVVPYTEDTGLGMTVYILIGVCGGLVLACILIMGICIYQNSRLSRKLKAATVQAFGSTNSGLNRVEVPGTNKHTFEGSNPVWNPAAESKLQEFSHHESTSDTSDNSMIPNEHFEGGLNNPSYEQRIENIFAAASIDERRSTLDEMSDESDHINDNFEYRRRSTDVSDIPNFPLSEL